MTHPTTLIKSGPSDYPSLARIKWFRQQLSAWGVVNRRDYPWRRTKDAYHLLVAESLLQKTDADIVAPIYELFLEHYPTIQDLAAANLDDVAKILKPLGLFFRAERLQQSAEIIIRLYDGKVPQDQKQLLKLPGIGDYTARAIGSQAFNQPLAVLDANVARILERFFGLQGERVKSRCKILWGAADLIAPKTDVGEWNLALLDFGALTCKAQSPNCQHCPLASKCQWNSDR
ncbi:helix-hairpin-helix domain-containing protein [Chamaesiphon minutus]|uniref:Adenine DNA glycosylase n=1 Tax=Chamaesiphon minutus (strain ATCC 27169 / PCC 6605) TaxID=1173020 RepID=K9UJH5_CHAP6|nr:helix-hairpin-helix domain-containing protein [Chamaesiphon minutus]AFY94339.1 A/G-specific DNA glycosylase [Chamaesiphon minutus PCC 6605]